MTLLPFPVRIVLRLAELMHLREPEQPVGRIPVVSRVERAAVQRDEEAQAHAEPDKREAHRERDEEVRELRGRAHRLY